MTPARHGGKLTIMRALVLGSGGAIGNGVASTLLAAGHEVVCVSRSGKASRLPGAVYRAGDRNQADVILSIVREHRIDTLIDMVAYTLAPTEALLAGLAGQVDRYVLIGSADVYRNYGLVHRKEPGPATPDLLDEDAPLRTSLFPYRGHTARKADDPARWMDEYDKIPVETAVRASALDWTILRLPMVYGPGDRQHRFRWAIAPMLDGVDPLTLPGAWARWTTTYGYVENVAAAIVLAASEQAAVGNVFNVTDTPPMDHLQWIERLRPVTGWRGKVALAETTDCALTEATRNLDLTVPLALSGTRLKDELGFAPPVSLDQALERTVASERALAV